MESTSSSLNPLNTKSSSTSIQTFIKSYTNTPPPIHQGSTNFQACMNLIKSFIGLGIMTQPYIFAESGYVLAALIIVLMGFLTYYTSDLAFKVSDETDEIYVETLGSIGKPIYKSLVFTLQCGICIAYIIFCTKFFQSVFAGDSIMGSKIVSALISCVIISPFVFVKNIGSLAKTSVISTFFIFLAVTAVTLYDIQHISTKGIHQNIKPFNITALGSTIGVLVLAFEAIGSVTLVRDSMNHPQKFDSLLKAVLSLMVTILVSFAVLNCLTFGSNIHPIVILGLEKFNPIFLFIQTLFVIAIILSFPIQFLSGMHYLESSDKFKVYEVENPGFAKKVRIGVVALIFAIAFIVPSFTSFINLLGSSCAAGLQLIFPIVSYHRTFKNEISAKQTIANVLIVTFAVLVSVFGFYHSLKDMIEA